MAPFKPPPKGRKYVSRFRNYLVDSQRIYRLDEEDGAVDGGVLGRATDGGSTSATETVDAEYEAILNRTAPGVPEPLNKRTLSKFLRDATGRGSAIEPDFLNNIEIHVICGSLPDTFGRGFVAHYTRFNHSLELRAMIDLPGDFFGDEISCKSTFLVGLSMAFNQRNPPLLLPLMKNPMKRRNHAVQLYSVPIDPHVNRIECNLELGQAVASLAYAGAALGWEVRLLDPPLHYTTLTHLMGLTYDDLEHEGPLAALVVFPARNAESSTIDIHSFIEKIMKNFRKGIVWFGRPYVIRHWDELPDSAILCTALNRCILPTGREYVILDRTPPAMIAQDFKYPPGATLRRALQSRDIATAADLDQNYTMGAGQFQQLVLRCCAHEDEVAPRRRECFPHGVLSRVLRVNVFFFVNRVEGLELGLYCLVRNRDLIINNKNPYRWIGIIFRHPALESQFYQFRHGEDYQGGAPNIEKELERSAVLVMMVTPYSLSREYYLWEAGFLGEMLAIEAQVQGLIALPVCSQYCRHFCTKVFEESFDVDTQVRGFSASLACFWTEIFGINDEDGDVVSIYAIGKKKHEDKPLKEKKTGS